MISDSIGNTDFQADRAGAGLTGWRIGGQQYTAYATAYDSASEDRTALNVLYLVDDHDLKRYHQGVLYFKTRPAGDAIIMIDNYEELLQNARENEQAPRCSRRDRVPDRVSYVEKLRRRRRAKLEKDRYFVGL